MKKRNNAKKQIKQKKPEKVAQAAEVTAAAEPETAESIRSAAWPIYIIKREMQLWWEKDMCPS